MSYLPCHQKNLIDIPTNTSNMDNKPPPEMPTVRLYVTMPITPRSLVRKYPPLILPPSIRSIAVCDRWSRGCGSTAPPSAFLSSALSRSGRSDCQGYLHSLGVLRGEWARDGDVGVGFYFITFVSEFVGISVDFVNSTECTLQRLFLVYTKS